MLRVRKWQNSLMGLFNRINPKIEYWIDKYQVIKISCVVGVGKFVIDIAVNSYFIYDGLMNALVLRKVKLEIDNKKEMFYRRVESRKEQILAIMEELEQLDSLPKTEETSKAKSVL